MAPVCQMGWKEERLDAGDNKKTVYCIFQATYVHGLDYTCEVEMERSGWI